MGTTSRSVGSLLSSVPTLKAISMQLDRIAAMQQVLGEVLPAPCAGHVWVHHEDGNTVVLGADSGAMAARARQLARRVSTAFGERFSNVAEIRCEVIIVKRTSTRRSSARRITPTGQRALAGLAGSLPAGDLKDALGRLLRAAQRSDRVDEPLEREEGERDGRHQ